MFAESRGERGWCPWCRAEIELELGATSNVCPVCNARYANAFAHTPPPVAEVVRSSQHSWLARTFIVIGGLVRIFVIATLVCCGLLVLVLIGAGLLLGSPSVDKQARRALPRWLTS